MSTVIRIEFPWGRYQATPWNRSANEGTIEWPPSPWRLLRAMYAAWKVHAPDLSDGDVVAVLSALATVQPFYTLPPHTEAHTRHYMPASAHQAGHKHDTSKLVNATLVMNRGGAAWVTWPIDLTAEQQAVFQQLLGGIRYLGRAESIVEVSLCDEAGDGEQFSPGFDGADESVELLAPDVPLDIDSLVSTPTAVRSARRLQPPSTRWVRYCKPRAMKPMPARPQPESEKVAAVRIDFAADVLPSRFDAVLVGDVMHRAVIKKSNGSSEVLRGTDTNKRALRRGHQHAHFLPIPDRFGNGARRITGLLLWAPAGLDEQDVAAVLKARELTSWRLDGIGAIRTVVAGRGDPLVIAPELSAESRVWRSVTPYAMSLHHKGSLVDRLRKDVMSELRFRGLPDKVEVSMERGPWLKFTRYRPERERLAQQRPAYGLRLEFAEPIGGPLALGQLSHFGLGMFRPVSTSGD